ncbi:glycosyltransferase [Thermocoleostomius sinensis]|uniref:4,4'-diaponeurosporenoate glycosyltransferase n=1 Tax=Thermocoleostomius sinensis A174 TaxID=2016057 RepID=A0A9E8Z8F6_9CYAN|nr:glycosyltransferase [Thermocoleostomius sinensis]WAL58222.1 glycosyltransferase [Thermocoleostomius sinensis A174]
MVETPPRSQCQVCVIVPAQNEAELLEHTLTALAHQVDLRGHPFDPTRYEIILLANNCNDDSAAIARRFAQQYPDLVLHVVERTLPASKANIGWVRKLLMDEACDRLMSVGHSQGVIASTDGDTQVAPDWIAATLYEIASGADAVGGRIITNRADRAALSPYARACHLREVGYYFLVSELESFLDPDPFDRWPRHFQHFGASLAVTAKMYQRAGGLPPVRSSEDVALYQALKRINARFCHSLRVRVTTSARQTGRAQKGLADQLSAWTAMGQHQQPFLVEPAAAIVARFQARSELRQLWQQYLKGYSPMLQALALPADRLGLDRDWLMSTMMRATSLGALFEQIEQQQKTEGIWQRQWKLVKIEQAIWELRLLLEPLRQQRNHSKHPSPGQLLPYLHQSLSLPSVNQPLPLTP